MPETSGFLDGFGLTALLVADARAAETDRPDRLFDDPFARQFVAAASAESPDLARALSEDAPNEAVLTARQDSVAVRTRFFDDYLGSAVDAGCLQIVLLAAGLDARAFRLRWPSGVRLWELDSPDVLSFKERVLGEVAAVSDCERSILPVDLRDDWSAALIDTGFNPSAATAWLIEGLLMYLDETSRDALLSRVGQLSPRGSRAGIDHRSGFLSRPKVSGPKDPEGAEAAAHLAALAAAADSDPSLVHPSEWLRGHGWSAALVDPANMFARYGRSVPSILRAGSAATPSGWIATAVRLEGEVQA